MHVNTIGVDLAKLRRKQVLDFFSKLPACLVGMEACGTAHHWAREISKLGHTVRLMPPSYVRAMSNGRRAMLPTQLPFVRP
jgi:transposase